MKNSIKQSLIIPLPVHKAFQYFTNELNSWWPKQYTWSGEVLEKIAIEPRENGRCYERGPHGFECDWGRVLTWDPPHRILFTWQISPNRVPEPNPEKVSEIEVLFKEEENKTNITFIHRDFEKHGENAESYKQLLESAQGWPFILNKYKEQVSAKN